MRKAFATFAVFVLLIVSAVAQVVTVGDGVLSIGQLNVYNPATGQTLNFSTIMRQALTKSQLVEVLQGNYTATAATSIAADDVRVTIAPSAIITVGHSGSVGVFDVTGDNVTIQGGRIRSTTFNASQSWVKFSSCFDSTVRDVIFEATVNPLADSSSDAVITPVAAPTGNTATPMVMVEFNTVVRKLIDHCAFLPDYAVTCVKSTDGAGIIVSNSNFSNNLDAGLGGLSVNAGPTVLFAENAAPRLCWRCIQVDGDEWGLIQGNRFFALGDSNYDAGSGATPYFTGAPYELDFVMRFKKGDSVPTGGLLTVQSETGHMRVIGNTAEWCAAPKGVQFWGIPSSIVTGNMFGLNPSPDALGECWLYTTDANDDASGSDFCGDMVFYGNNIHNAAKTRTQASACFFRMTQDLKFGGNQIGVTASFHAIQLAGVNIESASISGNSFRGNTTTAVCPIRINTGAGIGNGIFVGGNDTEGFLLSDVVLNDSSSTTDYYLNGLQDKLSGDQSATYLYSGTDIAATDSDTLTSSAAFTGLSVGDLILISGFTGAGITANAGLVTIKTFTSSSSIDIQTTAGGAGTLVADAAGETVTIRKINNRPYTYSGTDVDASDADTLVSSAKFQGLAVGDQIICTGFAGAGVTANNGMIRTVTVFTNVSSIDVSGPAMVADSTGTVTVRKVLTKPHNPFFYAGTDVAASDADTLTSSAKFTGLAVGDMILINGFTGAGSVTNNGQIRKVTVFTSTSSIDVSGPAFTADAAGELVTIQKVPTSVMGNVSLD